MQKIVVIQSKTISLFRLSKKTGCISEFS